MKSYWLGVIAVTAALLGNLAQASPNAIVLGTATAGGGFELYGRHLVEVLAETDPTMKIEIRATRGSAENLPLLEAGQLDIGLVEGNAAHAAFEGINRPKTALRIIAAIYPGPGMFVVRGDSAYRTLADLRGKPVAFGTPASGLTKLARDVLDGLGLTPERDFQAVFLDNAGAGPDLVLNGKVVALWGGGIGWPGFAKVAAGPDGARFIVPDADEIGRIQTRHPYLRSMVVPAGTYAGQNAAINTVGLWSFVLARADMPDDVAYRLASALHRGETKLAARLAQGRYTTAANTAREAPRRDLLHPGTVRYLREIGALR
ncbi:MAG: TAXI family TRAP transporter solute-binding subunit [Gammaproteobacteria bacterium]|nr:TAXI family TRAP transporter solute-binding subunit [Rhodocyclaceae bacterium]MBU3907750.1 TAXI family TRAP transporter solute-binding subunit [Gammaproteobacteria bacterium]MBU3989818.1 TAXI family TRAP transporter solute-binding subunit [Gammaproteobacteria bacterium]MBU4004396.1 TAXI family TRAP transporter solute-binding subunit [Gammaproteobacteria bacterium]MBU4019805.1 TAXI family TRAP transporter solute-binding subunit [Gammaproteobacteria bacterium]